MAELVLAFSYCVAWYVVLTNLRDGFNGCLEVIAFLISAVWVILITIGLLEWLVILLGT